MLSIYRDNLFYSFPVRLPLMSFSYLIVQTRDFSAMLERNGKSRYPCLVSDISGKVCNSFLLNMMLDVELLKHIPSIHNLLRIFIMKQY